MLEEVNREKIYFQFFLLQSKRLMHGLGFDATNHSAQHLYIVVSIVYLVYGQCFSPKFVENLLPGLIRISNFSHFIG